MVTVFGIEKNSLACGESDSRPFWCDGISKTYGVIFICCVLYREIGFTGSLIV